jgi:hypothetical protein
MIKGAISTVSHTAYDSFLIDLPHIEDAHPIAPNKHKEQESNLHTQSRFMMHRTHTAH